MNIHDQRTGDPGTWLYYGHSIYAWMRGHDGWAEQLGREDVLNQEDTISLQEAEENVEYPGPGHSGDEEPYADGDGRTGSYRAGVDERTPVDNFIRDNGRKYYVT